MPVAALALVLAAAALHAAWNALAKRAHDQLAFLWSSVSLASLVLSGVGWVWLPPGGPSATAWPLLVATAVVHALYFYALGRAFRAGDFSFVYPIARGLGVVLVPIGGYLLLDEGLSPLGGLGVGLVVMGITGINLGGAGAGPEGRRPGPGAGWAVLTGLSIATYSLVDKVGVTRLHPVPYLAIMGLGISVLLVPAVLARGSLLRAEWRVNRWAILVASSLNLTAYLLVLFAFTLSKAAYVVAARELSIVLSVVIGRLWLGEAHAGARLAASLVILAGVACVALAR